MASFITAIALAVAIVQRKRKRQEGGGTGHSSFITSPSRSNNANAIQQEISLAKRLVLVMDSPTRHDHEPDRSRSRGAEQEGNGDQQQGLEDAFVGVLVASDDEGRWAMMRGLLTPANTHAFFRTLLIRIVDEARTSQGVFGQSLTVLSVLAGASSRGNPQMQPPPSAPHYRVSIECIGMCLGALCNQIAAASTSSSAASLFQRVMSSSSSSTSSSSSSAPSAPSAPKPASIPLLKARALLQLFVAALVAYKRRMERSGPPRDPQQAHEWSEWQEWLAGVRADACSATLQVDEVHGPLLDIPQLDQDD